MFTRFFLELRNEGVPATLKEYLMLLEALEKGVASYQVEHFYHLARASLVKDERHLDRFDRVFARCFEHALEIEDPFEHVPEEWLEAMGRRLLTEEEKQRVAALGGFQKLMETLRKRLKEQKERHQGGSKWIGTGGTSPFGAYGYNPEGVRVGQDRSIHRRAVKVWDRREFRDLDDQVELGTRAMKIALRKLRRLARDGAADELDLDDTIRSTAANAGWLDLRWHASRRERTNVLLLLDAGGSMDDHVEEVERLFSAARAEFKHLEHFYFHNCLYESVWRDNRRRRTERMPTEELMATFGPSWRVVFVGDATMSPYEISEPGGSVEHWNEESGAYWMRRILAHWPRVTWINPVAVEHWEYVPSIRMIRGLAQDRMVPLTLEGIERAVTLLRA